MRQKIPMSLVETVGKKHYSKEELRERAESEIPVKTDDIQYPVSMPVRLRKRFDWYVKELSEFGLISNVDSDALGRYVMTEEQYWEVAKEIQKVSPIDKNYTQLLNNQKKLFDSVRLLGNDLGLTMAGRGKLEKKIDKADDNKSDAEKLFAIK